MWRWVLLLASGACGASSPTQPPSSLRNDHLAPATVGANDCVGIMALLDWRHELFPACPPLQYELGIPLCRGRACGQPCGFTDRAVGPKGIALQHVTRLRYDAGGHLRGEDQDGRTLRSCDWDGDHLVGCHVWTGETRAERDATGRLVAFEYAGERRALEYDGQGRLVRSGDETYRYDDRGWMVEIAGRPIVHDDGGRVVRDGERGSANAVTYQYDGDRLVTMQAMGAITRLRYDALGRLESVETTMPDSVQATRRYVYDDCSQLP